MSKAPSSIVEPLPIHRRRSLFILLVLTFIISVPIFAFYATGYRYNFLDPTANIMATGGLYVSVNTEESGEVFIDEVPVDSARLFRRALYIQDVTPGVKRVHVQKEGMHTWVKELPVYPHIVTEAQAMLFPERPQVRLITEYTSATGSPVIVVTEATTPILSFASTTVPLYATTSKATTTLQLNAEYTFIKELFGTTTTASSTVIDRVVSEVSSAFQWSTATATPQEVIATSSATTTVVQNEVKLYETGEGIFVDYLGPERSVPYYFCVPNAFIASTTELYGAQVQSGVAQVLAAASSTVASALLATEYRTCRKTIQIDTQWREVRYFTFMPGTTDIVLLHRDDGVFAVEVDDRSWQNTQRLYPESVEAVIVHNGNIYLKSNEYYMELLLTLIDGSE
jgi:hypothetical protein